MATVAYQLVLDHNQNNLKALSREILHFLKRLTVICDDQCTIVEKLNEIEKYERKHAFYNDALGVLYKSLFEFFLLPKNETTNEIIQSQSDAANLVRLLRKSAIFVLSDLLEDRKKINKVRIPLRERKNIEKPNDEYTANYHQPEIYTFKKFNFTINYFNERSDIYVKAISDLKSRLSQSIELHSDDILKSDPNRHVLENVTDAFISNVSTRCYRDIHDFLCVYNNSKYPYQTLPSVYQYQNNSQSSRIIGFNTDAGYKEWLNVLFDANHQKPDTSGFSILQLSHWLQERSLIPVIGHEVAHRVLRNIGSRTLLPQLMAMTDKMGNLGQFMRQIYGFYRPIVRINNITEHHKLELELMCDLLAATRFGFSFLYCWLERSFNVDCFKSQLYDEYGRLDYHMIESASTRRVFDVQNEVFQRYIIGKSLIHWLVVMDLENDESSQGMARAVNEHLDLLLLSTYNDDKSKIAIAMQIVKRIRIYIHNWNEKVPISSLREHLSCDKVYSEKKNRDFWMSIQAVSAPVLNKISQFAFEPLDKLIDDHQTQQYDTKDSCLIQIKQNRRNARINGNKEFNSVRGMSDIQWRIEFKLATLRVLDSKRDQTLLGSELKKVKNVSVDTYVGQAHRYSKLASRLAIEDYVYNTRNLLSVLNSRVQSVFGNDNSFQNELKLFWREQQQESLHVQLQDCFKLAGKPNDEFVGLVKSLDPLSLSDLKNPFRLKVNNLSVSNPIGVVGVLKELFVRFKQQIEMSGRQSYFDEENNIEKHAAMSSKCTIFLDICRELISEIDIYTTILESNVNQSSWLDALDLDFSSTNKSDAYSDENCYLNVFELELGVVNVTTDMNSEVGDFTGHNLCYDCDYAYEELLVGEYDYFKLRHIALGLKFDISNSSKDCAPSDTDKWLMNTSARGLILTKAKCVSSPKELMDKLGETCVIVNVSLYKADFRIQYVQSINALLKSTTYKKLKVYSFLSFGAEDGVLLANISNKDEAINLNKFLIDVFDMPIVSRTERIFTNNFVKLLMQTEGSGLSTIFDCALKIKLRPDPRVKLSSVIDALQNLLSDPIYKGIKKEDIGITNGNLDISLPIKSHDNSLLELRKAILDNKILNASIQRIFTDLRFKNFVSS